MNPRLSWISLTLILTALACQDTTPTTSDPQTSQVAATTHAKPPVTPEDTPATGHEASGKRVLAAIAELETSRDVTCWTSFRQLDFFVATLQYSNHATLARIAASKSLVRAVWRKASRSAPGDRVSAEAIRAAVALRGVTLPEDRRVALGQQAEALGLKAFQDYRSTSEHWRILLSIIQDEMRRPSGLKHLTPEAEEELTTMATTLTLELLVASGERAITEKSPLIEAPHVRQAYVSIAQSYTLESDKTRRELAKEQPTKALRRMTGLLIANKIKALRAYNASKGSILDDLQQISRIPLTQDGVDALIAEVRKLARTVARGLDPMRADNYLSDGSFATGPSGEGRDYIDPVYAENATIQLFPHQMMPNGDILLRFEPNPGTIAAPDRSGQEVKLLDHQMNAVRDSAVHWLVLEAIHQKEPFAMDPFAAEYLSEVVSMAMTLYLRRSQTLSRQMKKPAIDADVARRVRTRTYVMVPPREPSPPGWGEERRKIRETLLAQETAPPFKAITDTSGLPTTLALSDAAKGIPTDIQIVMGAGVAVGDINDDGYPDLFVAGEGLSRLYINRGARGGARFEDVTQAWGVPEGMTDARGALFFDREGDGDLDLLVLRSRSPSLLLDNEKGRFTDVAAQVGFVPGHGAHVASIFDADGDRDLDIYIGYYGAADCNQGACPERNLPSLDGLNGTPNQLWRLDGERYTEVGAKAGVADIGWTLATGAFDRDGDGDLDLYLANDFGANTFYDNQGDGTFKAIADAAGTADRGSGMNVSFSDINRDGRWDIYVTNIDMFSKNIKVIYPTDASTVPLDDAILRSFRYLSGNKLYVAPKSPEPRWSDEALERFEPGDRGWSWAGVFMDVENDGDEDLYLANGWIEGSYAHNQRNQRFIQRDGVFYQAPNDAPETFPGNSRSVVAADIDRDGDLDLVINNFRQPPVVLQNEVGSARRWLGLRLRTDAPNTRAIGAELTITTPTHTQRRLITCGQDYLGQQDDALLIGLGNAAKADVTVRWPSGETQRFRALRASAWHTLKP